MLQPYHWRSGDKGPDLAKGFILYVFSKIFKQFCHLICINSGNTVFRKVHVSITKRTIIFRLVLNGCVTRFSTLIYRYRFFIKQCKHTRDEDIGGYIQHTWNRWYFPTVWIAVKPQIYTPFGRLFRSPKWCLHLRCEHKILRSILHGKHMNFICLRIRKM